MSTFQDKYRARPNAPSDYKADWNMAELACWNLSRMMNSSDELSIRVEMRDNDALEPLYAVLHAVYRNISSLVNSIYQSEYDRDFADVRNRLNKWIDFKQRVPNTPFQVDIAEILLDLHKRIHNSLQFSGLKWPHSKRLNLTQMERGRLMLGISDKPKEEKKE